MFFIVAIISISCAARVALRIFCLSLGCLLTLTSFGSVNLWQNANQQALSDFQQQNFAAAKDTFRDPAWQTAAMYKDHDYKKAAEVFAQDDSATGAYNLGNALAWQGKLKEAIQAYDVALAKAPDFSEAQHNKKQLEDFLKQQQEQKPDQKDKPDKKDQQDQKDEKDENDQSDNDKQQQEQKQDQENKSDKNEQHNDSSQQQQENAQKQAEKDKQEQDKAEPNLKDLKQEEQEPQSAAADNAESQKNEQQVKLEQWLHNIPDNPEHLLKNKFLYEHYKRQRGET